jgi:type II secretory pathway pseudopilin PulG
MRGTMTRTDGSDACPSPQRQSGFTFVEVTIAAALVLILAWLVATLIIDGTRAQKYAERQARVTEITQDIVDEMRSSLGASIRIFGADAVGQSYRSRVVLQQGMHAPLSTGRLPSIVAGGSFDEELPQELRTGNELLMARFAWTDEFRTETDSVFRVDVYRLEYWYLTPDGLGPREGAPDGLNLARWVSEPLADSVQIDRIADPAERQAVCRHLRQATPGTDGRVRDPVSVVWHVGEAPDTTGTFQSIQEDGSLQNAPPVGRSATWEIHGDTRLSDPDILVYRHHSVATNFARSVMGVGRFGLISPDGDGFPHGFEVQVIGPSAARQILLHLSLVSSNNNGRRGFYDMQVVVDVRDL